MASANRAPRLVLALGIVAGLSTAVALVRFHPEQVGIATDVYYGATRTALEGGDPYQFRPPDHPAFGFLYPPIVLLAFTPHVLTGSPLGAFVLQTILNLVTAAGLAVLLVRAIEHGGVTLERPDKIVIAGYAFVSAGVTTAFINGQVNLQLAFAIAAGTVLFERHRDGLAGIAYTLAAVVKLFPAIVGTWLLRQGAWRAIGAATGTGLGLLAAGFLLFDPALTVTYVMDVLPQEAASGAFTDGPDPHSPYLTIRRQLAVVTPSLPPMYRMGVGALILTPVVLASYRTVKRYRDRLIALAATLLAVLLLIPLEPFYLSLAIYPLVPLAYLLERGTVRRLYLAGFLLLSLPVTMTSVEQWASLLPTLVSNLLREVADVIFSVVLPPTVGMWLVLAACVLSQHRAVSNVDNTESTR